MAFAFFNRSVELDGLEVTPRPLGMRLHSIVSRKARAIEAEAVPVIVGEDHQVQTAVDTLHVALLRRKRTPYIGVK
jgi:hypothetical protein